MNAFKEQFRKMETLNDFTNIIVTLVTAAKMR